MSTKGAVLVTRPADQSAALTGTLEAAGYTVESLPALTIVPLDAATIGAAFDRDPTPDFAIFVSTNAVQHGFDALSLDPATRAVAIGRATAEALRDKGATEVIENPGVRSEDLLTVDALSGDLSGRRVLIVRGDDGREVLRETLTDRGADVTVIDAYRRELPDLPQADVDRAQAGLDDGRYAAVIVMSLASHTNLETLLGAERLAAATVVTPSPNVVDRRSELGDAVATRLADGPDPDALASAVAIAAATMSAPVTQEAPAAGEDPAPPAASVAADAPPPAGNTERSGGLGTMLALALSVLALALSGYTFSKLPDTDSAEPAVAATTAPEAAPDPVQTPAPVYDATDDISALQSALREAETARGANRSALDGLQSALTALRGELAALSRQVEQRQDIVESLPGRVENVEQSVAEMQGIAAGTRTEWLLAEAEYYMQLANAQLQLARNPTLSAYALELADQRVRELADPAYTPVRRALADEMRALATVSQSDLEGAALRLSSLADAVAALPLADEVRRQIESLPDREPAAADAPAAEEGRLDRLWRLTKEQVSKGIRVRKLDESLTPLLSPEATYFLRTNLVLKFDTARLALLRGEQDAFDASLADAHAWLSEYFASEDGAVSDALATVAELREIEIQTAYPDISGSLTILRRTRTLANGAVSDDPAP